MSVNCYIGFGSNIEPRIKSINHAVKRLSSHDQIDVVKMSTMIETPAVGGPTRQNDYFNGAAQIQTTLSPHELLLVLLQIENDMGRVRLEKWGPRIIDLDLLLYGDEIVDLPELKIPHPLMHERSFVLSPMAEIAPHVIHPVLSLTMQTLLEQMEVA